MLRSLFARRWLLATLLVIVAAAVLIRLGIWQLDRLEARRAFNARVLEQQSELPLRLDADSIDLDLYSMEYRQAKVSGNYLPEDEIVLRNQVWQGELGVQLFTPLLIEDTQHVLMIQRGWIPGVKADSQARGEFIQPGLVTIEGLIRRAETDFAVRIISDPTLAPDESRLDAWNSLDLDRLAAQIDLPLLSVYLQRLPGEDESKLPFAELLVLDLSEGPHLGYAGQWFLFALVLSIGYPIFVQRQEGSSSR